MTAVRQGSNIGFAAQVAQLSPKDYGIAVNVAVPSGHAK